MFENRTEKEARNEILNLVKEYYNKFHKYNDEFKEGDKISYASRVYDSEEMINLVDSSLEFWLTSGRYTKKFENDFSNFLGIKYCSLVNSGSSANLLAFMALTSDLLGDRKINRGDEVITVSASFPTTISPIINYGAIPVFVDITIPEYNIDSDKLETALSKKTKAVMIAHTLGNPFNLKKVKEFCDKHNLWLIEDNCDALGSKYCLLDKKKSDKINNLKNKQFNKDYLKNKKQKNIDILQNIDENKNEYQYTGTIGDIGTSSFYPPHHITTGEGGAVYTNNPLLHKIIRSFRDWGRECICPSGVDNLCGHRFDGKFGELPLGYDHKYVYSHFGYNLKATDMQAAIGCAQIKKINNFTKKRRENFNRLYNGLEKYQDKIILPKEEENGLASWFGFLITCKEGTNRNDLVKHLENNNIQTRNLFAGNIIKHPCFNELRNKKELYRVVGKLDNTNMVMNNSFWIGVYPGMTNQKIDYVIGKIEEYL